MGTVYPLFDGLTEEKISIGAQYFDIVFFGLMIPVMLLVGVGPLLRWKRDHLSRLTSPLIGMLTLTVLIVAGLLAVLRWPTVIGLAFAAWIVLTSAVSLTQRIRHLPRRDKLTLRWRLPKAYLGMLCAHVGIAVFTIGVAMVNGYSQEKMVRLSAGETYALSGYTFQFNGVEDVTGPNYNAVQGDIKIFKDDRLVVTLNPQKRFYAAGGNPMTEAAIDGGLTRDIYVSLGEALEDGSWALRFYIKPFVRWIWLGAILMAFGGILAALDKRYRIKKIDLPMADRVPA